MSERRLSFPDGLAEKIRQSPCNFVVTGGGGWIGRATLEMLESALGDDVPKCVAVFGSSSRDLTMRSGRTIPCRELKFLDTLNATTKIFVHCAFLTKDRLTNQSVESFVEANKKISDTVAAAVEKSDVRGLFIPSSGAVYKKGTHTLDDDLQNNAYGVMKIVDEKRFAEIAAKKKIPLCMPRLFNLAGPFINKLDIYALASMIGAVLKAQNITIRAPHNVVRSYIHVGDLVSLAFSMMLEPKSNDVPVFDTAGDQNLEMGDLAEAVRKILRQPQLSIERPDRIQGKDDVYVGEAAVLRRMMAAHHIPLTKMDDQIRDTANYMQELKA